jgi:hypothetical protein
MAGQGVELNADMYLLLFNSESSSAILRDVDILIICFSCFISEHYPCATHFI